MSRRAPLLLCILDGFGDAPDGPGNAISQADPQFFYGLRERYPSTQLSASGEDVGLPSGLMGNSEVGHLNIGAGRVVYQDITRIDRSIKDGRFAENEALHSAFAHVRETGGALHLFGLVSDGGVHSSDRHLRALLELARSQGLAGERVVLHAFLDGRDTRPRSAHGYIEAAERWMQELGVGRVATVMGRYFAMDRDKRWERVQLAYDALTIGRGAAAATSREAIDQAYERGENDEFVKPTVIGSREQGRVRSDDAVLFFNFRSDRARQLTEAFVSHDFSAFSRTSFPLVHFVTMTRYRDDFPCPIAFPPQSMQNTLAQVLSAAGLTQLRIAETEKYAHVTFFFSGGEEDEADGEHRILVPSPKVATYDMQPEMSAEEVTASLLKALASDDRPDVTILNFANTDMVGHTGVMSAAVTAVQTVDKCLERVVTAVHELGGTAIVTADHGNIEQMIDPATGGAHTAHTTNLVPLIACSDALIGRKLKPRGRLCDIATTMLSLLGVEKPAEMDGVDLLEP